jgi:uncharacterized protein YjaG (DUF416 family)
MPLENFESFLAELQKQIDQLPHSYQMAFSCACCERAFSNYVRFSDQQGWGDPTTLRSSLDLAWGCVRGGSISQKEAERIEKTCKALAPNSDDFSSWEATAAQEAALMVVLLIRFTYDPTPGYPVRIASFNRDTIDMVVQIRENLRSTDPDLEAKIAEHPLMLAELAKQKRDLKLLFDIHTLDGLHEFENQARAVGKDNLGL